MLTGYNEMEKEGIIRATTAENMAAATEHLNRGNGAAGHEVQQHCWVVGPGRKGALHRLQLALQWRWKHCMCLCYC